MKPSSSNKIKPSIPMPRSVSLGPPPRSLLRLSRQQQQQQQQQQHATKQPMFHHHPHHRSSSRNNSNNNNIGFVRETTSVKKHSSIVAAATATDPRARCGDAWTWQLTDLSPVPFYHPLEQSAVHVKHVSLATISARISTFMRVNSISCTYHTDLGQVIGLTPSLLKFSVQLWKSAKDEENGDDDDDEMNKEDDTRRVPHNDNLDTTNEHVILEVSRVAGCAMEMQRLRNWLIYSVTTGDLSTIPVDHRGLGARCASRFVQPDCEQPPADAMAMAMQDNHHQITRSENDCLDALKIALTLLQSKCLDQNRLGMESLCVLTHRFNVSDTAALLVAEALIFGQGQYGPRLQQVMKHYFQNMERSSDGSNNDVEDGAWYDSDDECTFLDYKQGCTFGIIHNLALQSLLNALETVAFQKKDENDDKVATDKRLDDRVLNLHSRFWQVVLSALMYHIQEAEHRPHEASLAAACFHVLDDDGLEGGSEAMELLRRDNLLPAVIHAHEYGKVFHLTLERSSRNLMQSLNSATTTATAH